jgi:cobalt-zinc-cadmium resistance protein CzcA
MLALVVGASVLGIYNYERLPIDAVPDITNVQVQINTSAPGYSPVEAEQRITYLVETALVGLPQLDYTRSISRYGLSQVTAVFEDGTDIYFRRAPRRGAAVPAAGYHASHGPHCDGSRRDIHVHGFFGR